MNMEDRIASMFAELGFKVNTTGLKQFSEVLNGIQSKTIRVQQAAGKKRTAIAKKTDNDIAKNAQTAAKKLTAQFKKQVDDEAKIARKADQERQTRRNKELRAAEAHSRKVVNTLNKTSKGMSAGLLDNLFGIGTGRSQMSKYYAGGGGGLQSRAVGANSKAWARQFKGSLSALGPQGQSEMSKHYAGLEKEQLATEKSVLRTLKEQWRERLANNREARAAAGHARQTEMQEHRVNAALLRQQALRARIAATEARTAMLGQTGGRAGRRGHSAALGGAFGAAAGGLGGFLPGFGIAYSAMNLNRINQELQGNQMALTAITGSSEAARDTDLRFRQRANDLGIDWRATQPSFRKMLASGMGAGMNQGQVEKIFQGTAEYGRVMGLGTEDMKGSFRALEQIMNKGQVYSEELKTQLAERMPGVVSAMAQAYGQQIGKDIKPADLFKAMEAGDVSSETLISFADILSRLSREGGALEAAKQSTAAQQGRFSNSFSAFVEKFANAGFDRTMNEFFVSMAQGLDGAANAAEGLATAFGYLVSPVTSAISLLKPLAEDIIPSIAEGFNVSEGAVIAFGAVGAALMAGPWGRIAVVLGGIVMVLEDLYVYSKGGNSLIGALIDGAKGEKLAEAAKSFAGIAGSLGSLAKMSFGGWVALMDSLNMGDAALTTLTAIDKVLGGIVRSIAYLSGDSTNLLSTTDSLQNYAETIGRSQKGMDVANSGSAMDYLRKASAGTYAPIAGTATMQNSGITIHVGDISLADLNNPKFKQDFMDGVRLAAAKAIEDNITTTSMDYTPDQ